MDNTLVLVDGSSYFYRAFHALPPLTNSKGQALGAVYGVINMVNRLMKDYPTDYFTVMFDSKGKTFRDELYKDYKATREAMPEELKGQFMPMKHILEAMGIPILIIENVEADDVIGTLAKQAKKEGMQTVISTGDKDLAQLVDVDTTLINTMTNTKMDIAGVKKKFGIGPELIIDYLTLIGDKSDNIPGIPKVGPKTAVKWLEQYGSLNNIIEHADEIKGKVGESLREHLSQLPLAEKLVTIKTDVPLDVDFSFLKKNEPNKEKLIELFKHFEFNTWLKKLEQEASPKTEPKQSSKDYTTITDFKELESWLNEVKQAGQLCIDTETNALEAMRADLVGISISYQKDKACYIPLKHKEESSQLPFDQVLTKIKALLEDETIIKIGQNLKYDINILRHYNIEFKGPCFDTMLESYVLNATSARHDMDSMAKKYLDIDTIKFEDIAGRGKKQKTFDEIDIEKASLYAAEDADITYQLHRYLMPRVKSIPNIKSVFLTIEMPLVPVLANMEYNGVLIDAKLLQKQGEVLKTRILELEKEAFNMADCEFNLASTKQLQEILYDKLQIPVTQKTPKGQPSTAEAVLQELAFDYPLPKIILEHRSLSKLLSTYIEALPKRINPKTGRVHTSYNQAITATGRLSSTEPNLQNIPIRNELGREIRRAFIAPKGYKILACDYSQIELRIMAHLSSDKGLLDAFSQGLDIHKATAAEVLGIELDEVNSEQRRHAKAINFGLIYGMSAFGLAKQIGVERKQAQDYIDLYFSRYPGVKAYMEKTRALAHDTGYVETLCGRRLYLPNINAKNKMIVQASERTAINAPMQGTAADIIKLAMIDIHQWLKGSRLACKMIMQVHDELVFEVHENDLDAAKQEIKQRMESAFKLNVPLEVSIGSGLNWEEAH